MYEHNALGYWLGLALCLTKVSSSRARCPATALMLNACNVYLKMMQINTFKLLSYFWDIGKQYSPRCDAAECGVPSGAILFA